MIAPSRVGPINHSEKGVLAPLAALYTRTHTRSEIALKKHSAPQKQPSLWDVEQRLPVSGHRTRRDYIERHALLAQGKKRCGRCKEIKPLSEFPRSTIPQIAGGVQYACKDCYPTVMRASILRRKYGITQTEYDQMLKAQNFACAICGQPGKSLDTMVRSGKTGQSGVLNVDHDHATGLVRGLLCNNCNRLLGYARDDITTLKCAIEYLQKLLPEQK